MPKRPSRGVFSQRAGYRRSSEYPMTEQEQDKNGPARDISRRGFVSHGVTGLALVVPAWLEVQQHSGSASATRKEAPHEEEDIAPPEDLMREHGVLKRVL